MVIEQNLHATELIFHTPVPLTKWSFLVHSTTHNAPYIYPSHDSILELLRAFPNDLSTHVRFSLQLMLLYFLCRENNLPKVDTEASVTNQETNRISESILKQSERKHKEKSSGFYCKSCKKKCVLSKEEHYRIKHHHLCQICGHVATTVTSLKEHIYTKHKIVSKDLKVFRCQYEGCDKKFLRQQFYQDHLNKHTDTKPYICQGCEMKFRSLGCWRQHQLHCLGTPMKLECETCGQCFSHRGSLAHHRDAVHLAKRHFCACGKKYKFSCNLARHRKTCLISENLKGNNNLQS